ncbi:Salicylate hydroxylase [compost metagenome]
MLPHQGAGAGQGLEDAYFLAELLSNEAASAADVPALLAAYDEVRRERASRVQRTSWEAGELYEYKNPTVGRDSRKLKNALEQRLDWVWQHSLDDEVKKALTLC